MPSAFASPIPGPAGAPASERGNPAWSRVLLVEGTSGVGKSTLIDRLLRRYVAERPARKLRTLLHLTQAHTYGPLAPGEDSGTLTVEQNLRHLDGVVSLLEWHVGALAAETKVKFLAIVDTLHLTQCHRPGVLTWDQVRTFDERLLRLGARLLFLHGTPATLWNRGMEPRAHEEFILGYARPRFGANLSEIHRYFVAEQAAMRGHLSRTRLPSLLLDAEGEDHSNLDRAYAFWLAAVEGQAAGDPAT
jgi:hypothetical protein